ncbi:4Fe-4S dicluster domain-containing protein [Sulfurovum sp.]|uniref:4Fe-4S dicluster domain-containing protein n=1 Tax=Sulfurovum sp. TaxID=1969726 RepID=UPI0025D3ECBA|nr:4Fe-4S binding protein [Sulfurovum sp.]
MKLYFDPSRCVRATSKFSTCTKCVDAAPEHISMLEHLPAFAKATGVEAAACLGACPTEAFALSDFSVTEFFFTFLESKVRLISSKVNVPCLSVLSVEHLISLALASEEPITLDLHSYEEGTHLFEVIENRIEEANFVLSSFSEKQLETNLDEAVDIDKKEKSQEPSRRDFFASASLKGALKHKKTFDDAVEAEELHHFEIDASMISKIKDKHLPDKRKILFTALKRADVPKVFEVLPEEEVSFVSQKFVDEKCTNCQICYRICPTGALSSNGKFSLINFDAMLCVKCHLCHDACEPDAIHLQPGFEIKELFESSQRTLATFDVRRCNECGNYFTYEGGEVTCPRCAVEEEEAIFLHANAKRMEKEKDEEK